MNRSKDSEQSDHQQTKDLLKEVAWASQNMSRICGEFASQAVEGKYAGEGRVGSRGWINRKSLNSKTDDIRDPSVPPEGKHLWELTALTIGQGNITV